MPCWIKALPRAATIVCIIFSKSSLTAAASLDNGLQLSQPIVPRSVISIPEIVPRQVQNVFVNPSGVPSDKDFSNNPVFEIDTVVEIQWVMDGTVTEEVSLFLSVGINTSYAPVPQAIQRKISGTSFEWTVVNAFGALSQMFQLSMRIESSGVILFESRIFNVSVTAVISNSPDISPNIAASSAAPVSITTVLPPSTEATTIVPTTSTSKIVPQTSPTEASTSDLSSTAVSPKTSSSSDSPLSTSVTPRQSTTLSTQSTPSAHSTNAALSATTLISQTSTSTSITPTTTALASNSSKDVNSNSQKRAEVALGSVLGIVLFSIASFYLFQYIKTRQPFSKIQPLLVLFGKTSVPTGDAKIGSEKPPSKLKAIQSIPELEGEPIERAELYGGPREPVELDGGILRSKSMVWRVRDGIARTVVCPWRSSR